MIALTLEQVLRTAGGILDQHAVDETILIASGHTLEIRASSEFGTRTYDAAALRLEIAEQRGWRFLARRPGATHAGSAAQCLRAVGAELDALGAELDALGGGGRYTVRLSKDRIEVEGSTGYASSFDRGALQRREAPAQRGRATARRPANPDDHPLPRRALARPRPVADAVHLVASHSGKGQPAPILPGNRPRLIGSPQLPASPSGAHGHRRMAVILRASGRLTGRRVGGPSIHNTSAPAGLGGRNRLRVLRPGEASPVRVVRQGLVGPAEGPRNRPKEYVVRGSGRLPRGCRVSRDRPVGGATSAQMPPPREPTRSWGAA